EVARHDLGDAACSGHGEDSAELDAMSYCGSVGHVDARRAPALCRLGEGERPGRVGELTEARNAEGREFPCDPALARQRFAPRRKRACVAVGAFPAAKAVLHQVTGSPGWRLASL